MVGLLGGKQCNKVERRDRYDHVCVHRLVLMSVRPPFDQLSINVITTILNNGINPTAVVRCQPIASRVDSNWIVKKTTKTNEDDKRFLECKV